MTTQFKKQRYGGLHLDVPLEKPIIVKVGTDLLQIRVLGKNGANKYTVNFVGSKNFVVYVPQEPEEF